MDPPKLFALNLRINHKSIDFFIMEPPGPSVDGVKKEYAVAAEPTDAVANLEIGCATR